MPAGPAAGEPQTEARPFPHGGAGVTRMAKASERQIALGRRTARVCSIDGRCIAAEVLKNPLNHGRILDAGDHPQLPATAPTDLDVDRVYAFEPLRPGEAPSPIAGRCLTALVVVASSSDPGLGHDPGPIRTRRRKHTVIADQVRVGLWHQRGEPGDEVLGRI